MKALETPTYGFLPRQPASHVNAKMFPQKKLHGILTPGLSKGISTLPPLTQTGWADEAAGA